MKLGILISTYNKTDDAKINMEIIRSLWAKLDYFSNIKIVHAYNGDPSWYPQKYLEDSLVRISNSGHYQGASELIDAGVAEFNSKNWDIDYVVSLTSDFWLIKPNFIKTVIEDLRSKDKLMATNWWGGNNPDKPDGPIKAMATDMFILDYQWMINSNMFPLNFREFKNKYEDIFYYEGKQIILERLMTSKFMKSVYDICKEDTNLNALVRSKVREIKERNDIFYHDEINNNWIRKEYWPEAGIVTVNSPIEKQKILKEMKLDVGPCSNNFINSSKLDYYNSHV